jgi:hypothetical protein
MSATKKKPPVLKTKSRDTVNKKALVWLISAFGLIVVLMAVLLILQK